MISDKDYSYNYRINGKNVKVRQISMPNKEWHKLTKYKYAK